MRTLQEKYNGIQEGTFSKEHFLAEARMQQPQLITRFNGYDDAVQILKNKGMIQEAKKEEVQVKEASYKTSSNSKEAQHLKKGDIIGSGDEVVSVSAGAKTPAGKVEVTLKTKSGSTKTSTWGKTTKVGVKPKETVNEISDILRGFLKGVRSAVQHKGTEEQVNQYVNSVESNMRKPNGHEKYMGWKENDYIADFNRTLSEAKQPKATKKGLTDYRYKPTNEMDKYPYEQILRGIRVELEVLGVLGTPTAEEYAKALSKVSKNLAKDSIFYTNQLAGVNPKVDLHDKMVDVTAKNTVDTFNGMKKATLKEGIKNLIKKTLMENGEDIYEMQGPKSDSEYKSELADYLEDNQIYGYTDMIHDIMTGPDEEENSTSLSDFLDDHEIYGYNRGIERIFADYPYDEHWMNQPDKDEAEEIPGFEGTRDALNNLFEDTEADKNMVRKLMTMYQTEPSKFEKLHKQAQTQAATTRDIKFKHLASLFDRAKAGALQSLANQDKAQADSEGMDESVSLKDLLS